LLRQRPIHQAERIGRAHHAVEFGHFLKVPVDNFDTWQIGELLAPRIAQGEI
jgi:hypothetical protein